MENLDSHLQFVAKRITEGKVVPFLGAGVNLVGRASDESFQPGTVLPSGGELARFLADYFDYPEGEATDLVRVSQYASVIGGTEPLYDKLHELFDADYPPTPVHRFLASVPAMVRTLPNPQYQVIVTTNYDDALERAFEAADEEFDVVAYIAEGSDRGRFLHVKPDGEETVVERPNEYDGLSLKDRTVIAKIHGAVDRLGTDEDSFVITEDHYIDYLARTNISNLIPASMLKKLQRSHFLFMGYSLKDWNLRVILHRIWGEKRLKSKSWSVQLDPEAIDERSWPERNVEILDVDLTDYVKGLQGALLGLTADAGAVT